MAVVVFSTCKVTVPGQNVNAVPEAESGGSQVVMTLPQKSDDYSLSPDSKPRPGVTKGKTFEFELTNSKVFPETRRTITVYVPAAYKGDKPACVYVGLDGLGFNAATVFDNLIAEGAMPVTVGIGVSSGSVSSGQANQNPRFDRSFEFDSLNDRLARFLLDDVIPQVKQHTTPDGYPIILSENPNDRAIGGGSTGGIGALTVAWEHPDAFRRVFSAISTFVGMRGGEQFYVLVRKTEPKPIRVFMQDGVYDEWDGGPEMGDWWMSNQTMARALEFAGYDVKHVWGTGSHNGNHAASIFPNAMRWLWRDWPAPIQTGTPGNPVLKEILQAGENWQIVQQGCTSPIQLAANSDGAVFYRAGNSQEIARITSIEGAQHCRATESAMPFLFGPAGKLYLARADSGITMISLANRNETETKVLARDLHVRGFTLADNGTLLVTAETVGQKSGLWRVFPDGKQIQLDSRLEGASAIAFLPDGLWLFVVQARSRSGLSYRVDADGKLSAREPFYSFAASPSGDDIGAESITMDREGRAYVATRLGVQVFDRNGRVTAILPVPGNVPVSSICFGERDFSTFYVATTNGKVYRRKLAVKGFLPGATSMKLSPWGSG